MGTMVKCQLLLFALSEWFMHAWTYTCTCIIKMYIHVYVYSPHKCGSISLYMASIYTHNVCVHQSTYI